MGEIRTIRLDPSILSGHIEVTSTSCFPDISWRRQYEIWRHAKALLDAAEPSAEDCATALFQLNRAVDFRDKHLSKLYRFDGVPGMAKLKQHEAMRELGLIMPLMKTKVDKLRNRLMHDPAELPPPAPVCRELAEFVWYYLRSTDRLCSEFASDINIRYSDSERDRFVTTEVAPRSWRVTITGWVPNALIRDESEDAVVLSAAVDQRGDDVGFRISEVAGTGPWVRRLIDLHFAATVGSLG